MCASPCARWRLLWRGELKLRPATKVVCLLLVRLQRHLQVHTPGLAVELAAELARSQTTWRHTPTTLAKRAERAMVPVSLL